MVVDDHRSFAEVLAARLDQEPDIEVVEVAFTAASTLALAARAKPDVVLVDLYLAEESSLPLVSGLTALDPAPKVLVVSGHVAVSGAVESFAAGAAGFVPKSSSVEHLLEATHEAVAGHSWLPPHLLGPVIRQLLERSRAPEPTFLDRLSPRETEVLRCLVAGMTRAEVAERLYVSKNTVRTHVQNVLKEAGVHSTLALVAKAREAGVAAIDETPTRVPRARSGDRFL
jgi:two-component system nitrate/nitrite response regulator NarL